MLFNSLSFLVFFSVVFFSYYALPYRARPYLLLAASCYFYMAFVPAYILILLALILGDYSLGILIGKSEGYKKKTLLIIGIISNLGLLFVFKYFNFFNENIAALADFINWNYSPELLTLLLPLGLSFHIFQSLSYLVEVYKKKHKPEYNLTLFALYVLFFPQLVAGPIERPQHLLPQFRHNHAFDVLKVRHGIELMLIGFFKKVVIADQIAPFVNYLYANPDGQNGAALALAAVLFTYQLYCDFSGYSDIAVGSALVLGFDLTQNFERPFASRSIAEFWRRWHISLSSWLRDYLYYPLVFSGKRVTPLRIHASTFITFILIGLWHGANWTFVVMGALHGSYLVLSSLTAILRARISDLFLISKLPRAHHVLQVLVTFALVTISFVFFRASDIRQALSILRGIFYAPWDILPLLKNWEYMVTPAGVGIGFKGILITIVLLEILQYVQARFGRPYIFDGEARTVRWTWYYALTTIILFFGYFGEQVFIYFQF